MAKSGTTIQKREKEKARIQNRMDKSARRAETRERRSQDSGGPPVEGDPDIAGIVPGPQPLPPGFEDED